MSDAAAIQRLSSGGTLGLFLTNWPLRLARHDALRLHGARPLLRNIEKRGVTLVRSVLIVDDNPVLRKALCELFTREEEFDVCGEAENGQDAIERAQQLSPNLIVTDLSMPVMNGLEETRLLRQLMPAVPVIIYTAYNNQFIEKEAHAAGASAVIAKSEPIAKLLETARSLLDQIAA